MNVEKVIKGLECCSHEDIGDCGNCPYEQNDMHCDIAMMRDALELLKDSRLTPRKPYHTKVKYTDGREWITDQCPECVERGEFGIWDTLIDRPTKYCRRCGQAIDWSEYDGRDQIDWDEYMNHVRERANRMAYRKKKRERE